jgi:DNA-binding winged helix-turn-helix (wHTH) protein/tetratricopeptide (TPR) repeat protein
VLYLFDDYELNEQDFCLSHRGRRIPIEPKALRVLFVLVGSQGRLLEKKTILEAVWKDTFVEESTLTRAIAVLRKHLEDDPRSPKYIETVPTLGYRFIAQVEAIRPSELESSPTGGSPNTSSSIPTTSVELSYAAPVGSAGSGQAGAVALPKLPARNRIWLYGAAVAGLSVIGIVFFMRYAHREIPSLSTKDTIVLADFTNTSGEAVFDDTLRQGLIVQLEQSPVLRLASDGQMRKTLKLMGMKSDGPLTSEVSREACQRLGGDAVLEGSVSRLGSEYVIGLRARRCSTGEGLDAEQVQVKRKEDALEALSQIAIKFRTRIGESSSSIDNLDTPLAEATTSSLDALKAFSQATRSFNNKGSRAAIPLFLHATELDPQFAMAHVWLGRMYADLGEEALSIKSTQRAYELRERSSDRERFLIDVSHDLLVSGNLARAKETCEAWEQMYPRDVLPGNFLSGIIYPAYGQYEKALDEAKKAVEIDPDFVLGYRNAALNSISLDRLGEANKILQQATERKLFLPSFVTDSYRMAFLKGDDKGMKSALEAAPANPWLANYESATLLRAGHLASARVMSDRAVSLARQASRHDTEAQLQVAEAVPEALYGYPDIAKRQVKNALRLSKSRNVEYGAAFVMAMTGNSSEASKLVGDLTKRFPDDTLVQYDYVPTVQAALALTKKQPEKAIELLRETTPYELSQPLHPIYVRGQAFLAMGHPAEAAAEFQKILGHPGLVLNDPLFDLALLQLGRSYALLGDERKARAAYEAVLQLWSTADPGLSINQQARKEYAKL